MAHELNKGVGSVVIEVSISHTIRCTRQQAYIHKHGKTPLNEWSARRRNRYLQNTQQTLETNMHSLEFETPFSEVGRPHNYALERKVNRIDI